MASAPVYQYNPNNVLRPAGSDEDARIRNVNLAQGTYARGTILGEITTTGANDVETVTIGGSPAGGTWTYTATPPGGVSQVLTEAYNVSLAALQADLEGIYGAGNVIVTGTAGSSYVITFTGALARASIAIAVTSGAGLTGGTSPTATIAHTTTGAVDTGTFGAYASGNSDGTQNPKGILQYACTVDASGNITVATEVPGFTEKCVPMYRSGTFRCEELVGLDATAVTRLVGLVTMGNTSAGLFSFGAP
jgi:hypothetical protein